MTTPTEYARIREEAIQSAAVLVAMIEDIDQGIAEIGPHTEGILAEIMIERAQQDVKWGPQHYDMADWSVILGEEVGEVNRAICDDVVHPKRKADNLRQSMKPKPIKWRKEDADDEGDD